MYIDNDTFERLESLTCKNDEKKSRASTRLAEKKLLLQQLADNSAKIERLGEEKDELELIENIFRKSAEYAKTVSVTHIENVVSSALNAVFGGEHQFKIDFENKSRQSVIVFTLDDGVTKTRLERPDYGRGGGKIDIVTLALRLAILEITRSDGPIFLDEVGKHISKEFLEKTGAFLQNFSEVFGRQIFLITHNDELAVCADLQINVDKNCKGISEVSCYD